MSNNLAIQVAGLKKDFQTFRRREGIWGGVQDLFRREYQTLHAVNGISFTVKRGEMIGFIGPNGAGKSTTIKMLTGILRPTGGTIDVLGFDPFRERKRYCRRIGVVFGQRTQLWWDIAVIESFRLLGNIYQVPKDVFDARLKVVTEILELSDVLHTPVRKLSLGQRLRSDLAASLLHGPELLFLDEPTIGVDAVVKLSIRAFLKRINREFGTTILLTTHDLVEIEELCDRIIIIDHGQIVYDGSLEKIRRLPGVTRQLRVHLASAASEDSVRAVVGGGGSVRKDAEQFVIEYSPEQTTTVGLVRSLVNTFEVHDLQTREPEIEDILIRIYRHGVGTGASQ